MIIFSTKFYVNKELTMEKFIELAFDWVNGSPHYGFNSICWNGEPLYEIETEKQKLSIVQSIDKKILALRLENRDDENVIWTNDFVYEEGDINNIILVRLARDAADKESYVSRKFNRPRLMKTILKLGYGAMDNDLPISDKTFLIKEDNLEKAEKIISGKTKYLLPVVYVTKKFIDNNTILDTNELAKDLAGTAHVMVEDSTELSSKLKEKTDKEDQKSLSKKTRDIITSIAEDSFARMIAFIPDDDLIVSYRPEKAKKFIPLSNASAGQKTTTILTFLLAYGNQPLLLDQPEDDLDNRLVYDLIVARLKVAKSKRQIIVVTHNANIPVNGDSEYIISMDSETDIIQVNQTGTMDDESIRQEICDVMEGTKDAFEMRAKKYHFNIKE